VSSGVGRKAEEGGRGKLSRRASALNVPRRGQCESSNYLAEERGVGNERTKRWKVLFMKKRTRKGKEKTKSEGSREDDETGGHRSERKGRKCSTVKKEREGVPKKNWGGSRRIYRRGAYEVGGDGGALSVFTKRRERENERVCGRMKEDKSLVRRYRGGVEEKTGQRGG